MRLRGEWWRGGTSNALLLDARDVPADAAERDALVLRAMGSPDPGGRQLDGLGGGTSSTSKAAVVGPSADARADLDYTFLQVGITTASVDATGMCGNIAAAIAPYAFDAGLLTASTHGRSAAVIRNVNTGMLLRATFSVADGRYHPAGDQSIPGVPFPGSDITLDFLEPGGAVTGALFPTGHVREPLPLGARLVEATVLDAANPVVVLGGGDLAVASVVADPPLAEIAALRSLVATGLGLPADGVLPRVAVVGPPEDYVTSAGAMVEAHEYDVRAVMVSAGMLHASYPLTGAIATAVAARVPGTLVADVARTRPAASDRGELRIGHPAGVLALTAEVTRADGAWIARSATTRRTARRLMAGTVDIPDPSPIADRKRDNS